MFKKMTVVTIVLAILLLAAAMSGCTQTTTSPTVSPSQAATPTPAPTQGGNTVSGPLKVTAESDNFVISGSQGGESKINVKKGGYLVRYHFKGYDLKFIQQTVMGDMGVIPGGQYPGADGWTDFTDIMTFTSDWEMPFKITATEPYEIELIKLPASGAADSAPMEYSGNGIDILGPITLSKGTATFKIVSADLKKAGFSVEILDADGKSLDIVETNVGKGDSIDSTVTYDVPADGNYLIRVSANGNAEWTIGVSQ